MLSILIDSDKKIYDLISDQFRMLYAKTDIDQNHDHSVKYDLIISSNIETLERSYENNRTGLLIYIIDDQNKVFDLQHINIRYYLRKNSLKNDLKKCLTL